MSPASKGESSGAQEQETAAEVTVGAAESGAEADAVAETDTAATAEPATEEPVAAAGAEPAAEAESAAKAAPAAKAGTARRRTAAATAEKATTDEATTEEAPAKQGQPTAKPAAAKPAAARGAGRTAKAPAKAPAKKAKAPAASTEIKVDLPTDIFDAKVNVPLIHQVVVAQQAAARQGTHATKTRGQVRGGGRKPYRQKGTGRARQGSVRAPQFTGGGIVHGPVSRSHAAKTPKKMKAAALRGALSDRARHGLVQVVEGFVDGDSPRTAHAVSVLAAVTGQLAGSTSVLVVADRSDALTWKSLRNASGVHVIDPGQLNTYDVLVSDRVVFTKPAFESFVARVGATEEDTDR
jgi:large subunit ribosomal protein L4